VSRGRRPGEAVWIEDHHLEDPEIAKMVADSVDGIRGAGDDIENDPALRPTAGIPGEGED
jgi:hypothetical protein